MGCLTNRLQTIRKQRGAWLLGIVNATPDSFYDGGRYADSEASCALVERLLAEGADALDIGGESTRPGSTPVMPAEQIARIDPALSHALAAGAVVSVDTASPEVAEHALRAGAQIVNDVSCLRDPDLARVTARHGAVLVLMHSREPMSALTGFSAYPDSAYGDVVTEVLVEWRRARDRAVELGMPREDVWLDPGIGFAKNARQSFELLRRLSEFTREGVPVVVGPSRKSFIASLDDAPASERLGGTIAACLSALRSGASVLRVHDVRAVRQAMLVAKESGEVRLAR